MLNRTFCSPFVEQLLSARHWKYVLTYSLGCFVLGAVVTCSNFNNGKTVEVHKWYL
ncbi:hypothetical protein Leryth_027108 [Lithospermum erythrorhizon]|nr:hypothetical protein Leryth_027108 [Lithospermum erythrorhizon]